ncbi:hypothetical protein KM043_016176 [Ampulex compressa]|nr:hypothetical protein KM043_016176 [Ampulex compressa]
MSAGARQRARLSALGIPAVDNPVTPLQIVDVHVMSPVRPRSQYTSDSTRIAMEKEGPILRLNRPETVTACHLPRYGHLCGWALRTDFLRVSSASDRKRGRTYLATSASFPEKRGRPFNAETRVSNGHLWISLSPLSGQVD